MKYAFAGAAATLTLVVGAASSPSVLAQPSAADSIFTNGKIVTVDEQFRIAEAVAVRGDRIVAVGTAAEIGALASADTETIDLGGRTVIPGLIDNHLHLLRAGLTWLEDVRLDGIELMLEKALGGAKPEGPYPSDDPCFRAKLLARKPKA